MDYNPKRSSDIPAHPSRDVENQEGGLPDRLRVLGLETDSIDVILDGSLFTTRAIDETLQLVRNESSNCYISSKFVDAIGYYLQNDRSDETDALSFYEAYDEFEDLEPIYETITSTRQLHTFDLAEEYGPGDIEGTYYGEYYDLLQGLSEAYLQSEVYEPILENGSRLSDILFEELVFGLSRSPIASRLKKVYRRFARAVGPLFEIPEDNISDLHIDLATVDTLSENEYQQVLDKLEGTAEQAHLKTLNEIERTRQRFKTYSPNWIGTPMKYAVPVLVGVALGGPAGILSGVAGQAGSIGGSLLAYDGCVWLTDP